MIKYHTISIIIDDVYKEQQLPYKKVYYIACDIDNNIYIHYDKPVYKDGYYISIKGKYLVANIKECNNYESVYKCIHEKAIGYKSTLNDYDPIHLCDIELHKEYYSNDVQLEITGFDHLFGNKVIINRKNCTIKELLLPIKRLTETGFKLFKTLEHQQKYNDYIKLMENI